MMPTIALQRAQNRLLIVWALGSALVFLATLLKTFDPAATSVNKIWAWTVPSVFPTLLLIVGARAGSAIASQSVKDKEVDLAFFRITGAISIFYLVTTLVTLWGALHWSSNSIDFLATSSFYLGPLQGLASASLGAFFMSRKH